MKIFCIFFCIALLSCKKETPLLENKVSITNKQSNLTIYYDKSSKTQVVYQVFKYDGVNETNLTNDLSHNYWWTRVSPDKTKFLCYRSPRIGNVQSKNPGLNYYANADLMIYNIDGSSPKIIIPKGSYGWKEQGVAKWHPDGNYLLMAANCTDVPRGFNTYNWRLIITDTEGLSPKIISTRNSVFADPAWSPDGNKIVYVSLPPGLSASSSQNLYEIYVADYNESTNAISNEVRLTNDKLYCFDPCWSPDGQYIAFTTCRYVNTSFNSEIIRIKPDGSNKMTIMNDNLSNAVPYWTEDSKRVYFHTLGIGTSYSIASCDAVNGGDKQIHLLGGGNTITYYTTPQPVNH